MTISQLLPGLFEINMGGVNAFLLQSTDGWVLIDTAYPGAGDVVLGHISEGGIDPASIRHILVTHWHNDHMGGAAAIKRATGAQVYAHPLDAPLIRQGGDADPHAGVPRAFLPGPGMEALFKASPRKRSSRCRTAR